MSLFAVSNMVSLVTQRHHAANTQTAQNALQKLSSGLRINGAQDDAAGLAIASRMTSQIKGQNVAVHNAMDGLSLLQTADGALASSASILQRVRELAVQSANATNSTNDRQALNHEAAGLMAELSRIAQTTELNGFSLLSDAGTSLNLQLGANAGQGLNLTTDNMLPSSYGMQQTSYTHGYGAVQLSNQPWGVNGVTLGTVNIEGIQNASIAVNANESAQSIAAKVNATSGQTGVAAVAVTSVRFGPFSPGNYELTIQSENNTPTVVSFNMPSNDAAGMEVVANAFNAVSAETGVTAFTSDLPFLGVRVILQNSAGADIRIADTAFVNAGIVNVLKTSPSVVSHSLNAGFILDNNGTPESLSASGSLQFYSSTAVAVTGAGTNAVAANPGASGLLPLSSLNISSAASAQQAMALADAALDKISSQRSSIGAWQSRLEQTVQQLQAASENQSAARGRIQDADFAQETASLSKAKILQDAGAAMLVQANVQPKILLNLLLIS